MKLTLPYQWSPRPYQQPVWDYLSNGGKRAVICWPRRHGKDDIGLQHMACAMGERKGTYWYLLPEYAQARKAIWDAIDEETGRRRIDGILPPALREVFRENEMIAGYGGSTMQVVGADNYNSLVGSPPVGVVFSEYARTDPSAWAYIMPIIEKNRGWAVFNSTPFGDNHFKTFTEYAAAQQAKGKDWFYQRLTADQCGVYGAEQLQAIQEQLCTTHGVEYGNALFLQEYYTSFDAAIPGSIWGDCLDTAQREGRIHPFAVDTRLPVYTGWDLGRTDATAIWWYQILHQELLVFDYHESNLKDLAFYGELLEEKRQEWGITYARHWLPHDARPRTLVAGAGSILQQMTEAARRNPKLGAFAIAKRLDKQEQIQAGRATLPRCRFHETRTAQGLKALRHYHREWDAERKLFTDVPVHDWASHPADAFMTVSTTWKLAGAPSQDIPEDLRVRGGNPTGQTFGTIKQQHLSRRKAARQWATA